MKKKIAAVGAAGFVAAMMLVGNGTGLVGSTGTAKADCYTDCYYGGDEAEHCNTTCN